MSHDTHKFHQAHTSDHEPGETTPTAPSQQSRFDDDDDQMDDHVVHSSATRRTSLDNMTIGPQALGSSASSSTLNHPRRVAQPPLLRRQPRPSGSGVATQPHRPSERMAEPMPLRDTVTHARAARTPQLNGPVRFAPTAGSSAQRRRSAGHGHASPFTPGRLSLTQPNHEPVPPVRRARPHVHTPVDPPAGTPRAPAADAGTHPKPPGTHHKPLAVLKGDNGAKVTFVASKTLPGTPVASGSRTHAGTGEARTRAGASTQHAAGPSNPRVVAPHHAPHVPAHDESEAESGVDDSDRAVAKGKQKATPGFSRIAELVNAGRPANVDELLAEYSKPESSAELEDWVANHPYGPFDPELALELVFPHPYLQAIVEDKFPTTPIHRGWGPHLPRLREVALFLLKSSSSETTLVSVARRLRSAVGHLDARPVDYDFACAHCVRFKIPCNDVGRVACFECVTRGGNRSASCGRTGKTAATAIRVVDEDDAEEGGGHEAELVPGTPEAVEVAAPKVTARAVAKPEVAAPKVIAPKVVAPKVPSPTVARPTATAPTAPTVAAPIVGDPIDKDDETTHLLTTLRWHMLTEEEDESRKERADVLFQWLLETSGTNVTVEELDDMIEDQSRPRRRVGRPAQPRFSAVTDRQRGMQRRSDEYYQRQKDEIAACGRTRSQTATRSQRASAQLIAVHKVEDEGGEADHHGVDSDNDYAGPSTRPAKKKARLS